MRLDPKSGNSAGYASLSLDQWIAKFGRIYGKRHDKHTTEYMISRLVEEVAELVNPMESQDKGQIAPNLADVFSWTCSLAFKLGIDLPALAWQKYGVNAPRPAWSEGAQPMLQDYAPPLTLREWQGFISKLYRKENMRLTPTNSLVAMMKDVGDLAMLNRKRAPMEQITSKLSAILAWTLTIAELLQLDLAAEVFTKYDDHCPSCGESICDTDVCHPFKTMYVSFAPDTSDEEKYAILDSATSFGFKPLLNPTMTIGNTRDLSTSLDLISRSDAASVVLSGGGSNDDKQQQQSYKLVFDALACYSILSKGNVWIFEKDGSPGGLAEYIERAFANEKIKVMRYKDSGNLKGLFENCLGNLKFEKKKEP